MVLFFKLSKRLLIYEQGSTEMGLDNTEGLSPRESLEGNKMQMEKKKWKNDRWWGTKGNKKEGQGPCSPY